MADQAAMGRFHGALGRLVARYPIRIVIGWVLIVVALRIFAPAWDDVTVDGDLAHLPPGVPSTRADALLDEAFPASANKSSVIFAVARKSAPLSRQDRDLAIQIAARVNGWNDAAVNEVWTETTPGIGRMLRSRDRRCVLVVVQLETEFMAVQNMAVLERSLKLIDEFSAQAPSGLEIAITGSAAIGADMLSSASESIQRTHIATVTLVLLALTLIYRSPILVIVPLLTIATSLVVATDLLAQIAFWLSPDRWSWSSFRIFKTTQIFIVVVLFGAGTDYCLFLISRFRELLHEGNEVSIAIREAIRGVGPAVVASGLTTVVGLAMMGWSEFGKFSSSGPAIAGCLIVALAASLTFAPALLSLVEHWLPAAVRPRSNGGGVTKASAPLAPESWSRRTWARVGVLVTTRPVAVLLVSVVVLSPLAIVGWHIPVTYDLVSELDPSRPSRRGIRLLKDHFPIGRLAPLTVLIQTNSSDLLSDEGRQQIALLGKQLHDVGGVAAVLSLDQPFGDPPGATRIFSSSGLATMAARRNIDVEAAYVSQESHIEGQVSRLQLILDDDPFSAEALVTLQRVREAISQLADDVRWQDFVFEVAGVTAGIQDLRDITLSDRRRIQWLVVLAVYAVLVALLRRPVVAAYLILTVLLSYFLTIGATEMFFSWLYADSFVGIDWKVPLFLFVILVAVGEDYNIYVMTRILEEQPRLGRLRGIRAAVEKTGGVVTSCGVIMAGTFVAMMAGSLRGMIELGFALSLGILLDTFVVRTVLVPAFMAMLPPGPAHGLGSQLRSGERAARQVENSP